MKHVGFKDKDTTYNLQFPEDVTDGEIQTTIERQFPVVKQEVKLPESEDKTSVIKKVSIFALSGPASVAGYTQQERRDVMVSPLELLKGAASILLTAPKKLIGMPLTATGERLGVIKTDEENFNRVMDDELALYGRISSLLELGFSDPMTRAGIKMLADMTPLDETITRTGRTLSKMTDNMVESMGFTRPEGDIQGFAYDAGAAIGSLSLSIGMSAIGIPSAGIGAVYGLTSLSDTYEKARFNGLTIDEAFVGGGLSGSTTAILQAWGLEIFSNKLRGVATVKRNLLRIATEVSQEASESLGINIIEKIGGIDDKDWQTMVMEMGYASLLAFIASAPTASVLTHLENTGLVGRMRGLGLTDNEIKVTYEITAKKAAKQNIGAVDGLVKDFVKEGGDSKNVAEMRNAFEREIHSDNAITDPTNPTLNDEQVMIDSYIKSQKLSTVAGEEASTAIKSGVKFIEKALTPISTRLAKINPEIAQRLRRYEFDTKKNIQEWVNEVKPFIDKYKKLPVAVRASLDGALKNGQITKIVNIVRKHNMVEEYSQVKSLFDTIFSQANSVGVKVEYRKNFFARKVRVGQVNNLMNAIRGTEQFSKIEEATKGLNEEDKAKTINAMLRGYAFNNITLKKPGNFKSRLIEDVTPEISKFYDDSSNALVDYIISSADAINAKRFFRVGTGTVNESIGELVTRSSKEFKLNSEQEQELQEILTARFNQIGTHGIVSMYKNLEYGVTLGQIYNTFTQFGDLYFSLYRFGLKDTLINFGKTVAQKADIRMSDIGLTSIAEEFSSREGIAKVTNKILQATGLTFVDKIGKETLINSAMDDAKRKIAKGDKIFTNKINTMFGGEADSVINDITGDIKSPNALFYVFNELSDFQPISFSEVPELYLKGGNARLFYMLKTFGIKQLDVYRREAFDNLSNPKTAAKGAANLFRLIMTYLAINVPVDIIKDLLKGKEIDLEDSVIDNLWKLVLFNRYSARKVSRDGLLTTILRTSLIPPANLGDRVFRDIANIVTGGIYDITDLQSLRNVPVVGELIYRILNA